MTRQHVYKLAIVNRLWSAPAAVGRGVDQELSVCLMLTAPITVAFNCLCSSPSLVLAAK